MNGYPIKLVHPNEDEDRVDPAFRLLVYTGLRFQLQNFIDGRFAVMLDAFRRGDGEALARMAATPYP